MEKWIVWYDDKIKIDKLSGIHKSGRFKGNTLIYKIFDTKEESQFFYKFIFENKIDGWSDKKIKKLFDEEIWINEKRFKVLDEILKERI